MFSFGGEVDNTKMYESTSFKRHARNVITTVDVAVSLLEQNDMDTLVTALKDLGGKHVAYGVVEEHYPIVGQALLTTLATALGDAFTTEVKEAWTSVFGVITEQMLQGAKDVTTNKTTESEVVAVVQQPQANNAARFPFVSVAVAAAGLAASLYVGRVLEMA